MFKETQQFCFILICIFVQAFSCLVDGDRALSVHNLFYTERLLENGNPLDLAEMWFKNLIWISQRDSAKGNFDNHALNELCVRELDGDIYLMKPSTHPLESPKKI